MAELTLLESLIQKRNQERQALLELNFRTTCLDQAIEALKNNDIELARLERTSEDFTDTIMYAHEYRNELPTPETIGAEAYKVLKQLSPRGPVSIDTITKYVQRKYPHARPESVRGFLNVYQNDRRRPRNIRKVRPGYFTLENKGPRRLLLTDGKAPRATVQDTIAAAVEGTMPRGAALKKAKVRTYRPESVARRVMNFLEAEHRVVTTKEILAALEANGTPVTESSLAFLYTDHRLPGAPFKKVGPGKWAMKGLRGVPGEADANGNGNGAH